MYTPEEVYMRRASQMRAQEFFCGMAAASPVSPSQNMTHSAPGSNEEARH